MRVVIQRVKKAQVAIEGKTVGSIDQGLVVLLGIEMADHPRGCYLDCKENHPTSYFF